MSALAGRLGELRPTATGGTPCLTCQFLASSALDDEDRAALTAKLDATTGRVGARELAEFLAGIEGAPTSQSIENHRRKRHG